MLSRRSLTQMRPVAQKMLMRLNSTAAPPEFKEDLSLGHTFRFQNSLPHLPVPTLQETAQRYLRTVKPLVLPKAYAHTEKVVQEFIRPGGPGERLQQRLEAHAAKTKNWLYEFWNEAAYMAYRDPIVPYVSYFYSYKDDPRFATPAGRAAAIVSGVLKFKNLLDTKTLEPDYMRKAPIDMELIKFLFHNCRIPRPNVDENAEYPIKGNEHILVTRRNRFYKVPYLKPDGTVLTTAEIEEQLQRIYNDADLKGTGPNIGVLTTENRDVWVDKRENLLNASTTNAKSLEQIQSAAFVVCLDFSHPETNVERVAEYWHGHGRNRFFDKPAQFIINDNGTAGFIGEHSMMDGTTTHRLNDYVCEQIFTNKLELTKGVAADLPEPEELEFVVNDKINEDITTATTSFWREIDQHEVAVWVFDKYGKNQIKKFKTSPDAYVQMLLQLAYYRLFSAVRPIYESAATRKFAQGRTETCRSVSIESVDFVKAFWSNDVSDQVKIDKFRKAVNQQVKYIADASDGRGVDRHLFGLKKMIQSGEEIPDLYKDPAFSYSGTWYISSSQLSSEYFNGYGWSEVIPEGFGCAYMINGDNIQINICSKKMGSYDLRDALQESAEKLAQILSTEVAKPKL